MKNICFITNFPSHYRKEIYELMDSEMDCDFVFGDKCLDIKPLDYSHFKNNVDVVHNKIRNGIIIWQKGTIRYMFKKYDAYILIDDLRCYSTWVCMFLALLLRKKIYLWSHGWYGRETRLKKIIKKIFYYPATKILLYGNYAKDIMIKAGYREDKLVVIHNSLSYTKQLKLRQKCQPTDIYTGHFGNNNPVLLFIGRLTKEKHLDMILNSLISLKSRGKLYNLVLIGDGVAKKELELLVDSLNLGGQVWFYGACYDEETNAELVYNADLCVSPGFVGLTAMHSMIFGTPVLTHDNFPYQMPEFEAIHPGLTGDFFHFNDVHSMTDKIEEWFDMGKSREVIRESCYKEIDNEWTPEYQIKKILQAIEY